MGRRQSMHDECIYFLITEFMSCCVLLCSVSLCPSEYTASTNTGLSVSVCLYVDVCACVHAHPCSCVVSQYLLNPYSSISTTPYLWCVCVRVRGQEQERVCV